MMDFLYEIFKMQKKLEEAIGAEIFQKNSLQGNSEMKDHPNQIFILLSFVGVITEACEALEQTPWKPWKESMTYNQRAFQEELIDLLHFVLNLFLAASMEPQDVYKMFKQKHVKNMKRNERGY